MGRHTEIVAVGASEGSREEQVRKWLSKPADGATQLTVAVRTEMGEPLEAGTYSVKEVAGVEGARTVMDAMNSYALASGPGVYTFALQWADDAGKRRGMAKPVQVSGGAVQELENAAQLIAGDQRSLVSLAQVQSLAVQKLYLSAMPQVLSMLTDVVRIQGEVMKALGKDYNEVRRQRDAAESEVATSVAVEESETKTAEAEAVKIVQQLVPLVGQAILAPK